MTTGLCAGHRASWTSHHLQCENPECNDRYACSSFLQFNSDAIFLQKFHQTSNSSHLHTLALQVYMIMCYVNLRVTRPIFVTKTKIKTKMIPFRFIKTKTKTISFQKNVNETKIKMFPQKTNKNKN